MELTIEVSDRIYNLDSVLDLVGTKVSGVRFGAERREIVGGQMVKINTKTLRVFKLMGTRCAKCGLKASFFVIERTEYSNYKVPVLRLYGLRNGKKVQFTKDHIVPTALISRGPKNDLLNLQTMCEPCNTTKSNSIPSAALLVLRYFKKLKLTKRGNREISHLRNNLQYQPSI